MPRASDFHEAARHFEAMAESLARTAREQHHVAAGAFGLVGPAADAVDDRIRRGAEQLALASDGYAGLALECARRAEVCADYARRWAQYRALSPIERAFTPAPTRPAAWAEA